MRVEVRAQARLHFGFLDLSGEKGRRFGGMGVAISQPRLILKMEKAKSLTVEGEQAELEYTFTIQSAPEEAQISRFTSKNTSKGFLAPPYISAWKTAPSFLEQRGSSSAKPGSTQRPSRQGHRRSNRGFHPKIRRGK